MTMDESSPVPAERVLEPSVNAVVQAAAGTGKTWLLTSRILRLLLAGTEPAAILALTFTHKAAGEIRERVLARARSLALARPEELRSQLALIGAADSDQDLARTLYERLLVARKPIVISTFHGFCQTLLRRFPIESQVPPDFEVIENADGYVDASWSALLEDARLAPASPLALALEDLSRRTGSARSARLALQAFWNRRSEWWAYTQDEADPVAAAIERLQTILMPSAMPHPELARDLATCARTFSQLPGLSPDLADILPALSDPDWRERLCPLFLTLKGEPRRFPLRRADRQRLSDAASIEAAWHRAAERLAREEPVRNRPWTLALSVAWYRCGHALVQHVQHRKAIDRVLDFADLEWRAYSLLCRSPHAEWVHYKLDQKIEHILIDEFQDTSQIQWQLLLPFVEELAAGDHGRRRSIFVVGDEKQSLYGFRGGDVRLLGHVSGWLTARMDAIQITEDTSRRASAAITDFANLVFSPESGHAPLPSFRAHASARGDLWGRVEILPLIHEAELPAHVPEEWRNPLSTPASEVSDERYLAEAAGMVRRIQAYVGSVTVGEGENARRAGYRDILVLLRDRTNAAAFEDALREAGIPFSGVDRGKLGDALEIRDVLNLLAVLLAPEDDLALAALLRTPIFSCTDAELMEIAARARDSGSRWWDTLATMADHPVLLRARERLSRWIAMVDRIPVHDLLDAIFTETDIVRAYERAVPETLRPRIAPAFHSALHLALDLDAGRYPGLARFRDHLKRVAAQLPTPKSAEADEVRVMTVHGAKGLEAPIVFLVDTARPRRGDSGVRPLIQWPPLAPKPELFHLIGKKEAVDDVSRAALALQSEFQGQENMNALYVAITRAAQILVISGSAPKRAGDLGWYGLIEERLRSGRARAAGILWNDDAPTADRACVILERGQPLPAPAPAPLVSRTRGPRATRFARTTNAPSPLLRPSATGSGELTVTASRAARLRGDTVHRLLQLRTSGMSVATARRRVIAEFPSLAHALLSECSSEVETVLADARLQAWFDRSRYRWARNEMELLYLEGGQVIHGAADRVVMYEDHVDILDYKSHARIDARDAGAEAERYRGQLRLYEQAVHRLWPSVPCRSYVLFTALPLAVGLQDAADQL
ncbi:MAG: UvrD-helicase domain-containing protein [Acidiferrobacteraceae bacterium]